MGETLRKRMLSLKQKVRLTSFKIKAKRILFILSIWALGLITGITYYYAIKTYQAMMIPRVIAIDVAQASTLEYNQESTPDTATPPIAVSVDTNMERILDTIYSKESSSGKNDQKCEREGGHNGYGYGQGVGRNLCFESDDETRETVRIWVQKRQAEGLDEKTLLCYYNTGVKTNNCSY